MVTTATIRLIRPLRAVLVATVACVMAVPARADAQGFSLNTFFGGRSDDSAVVSDTAAAAPMRGLSGKLRLRIFGPRRSLRIPVLARLFGDSAIRTPGIHSAKAGATPDPDADVALATVVPFEQKDGRFVNGYRVGFWPEERGRLRNGMYLNPDGFVQVTRESADLPLSEHFSIRDFLTHDQSDVWPKYVVLRDELIDKLELVIAELNASGVPVTHMKVISGFRHPEYNQGLRSKVRRRSAGSPAQDSRHQFGDAADVIVDNNRDGRMDDLNRDGKSNSKDIRVLIEAVERVERRFPELVGGAGTYKATRQHGPFVHIDVRGNRARWGRI
ncbi:MAG: hypothetical protein MUF53_05985 [Gemmatimonadaceae bacterium]|jgi:hypothetical protein|nr:hypothetical protein [Gemmatimonadaceae bacterium]